MNNETKISLILSFVFGFVLCFVFMGIMSQAKARNPEGYDFANPPEVKKWYQTLQRPDVMGSCCGEADAFWADGFETNEKTGEYIAIITDERDNIPGRRSIDVGTKIVVPNEKIQWHQGNPTGHGVIFLNINNDVLCYVPPGGV